MGGPLSIPSKESKKQSGKLNQDLDGVADLVEEKQVSAMNGILLEPISKVIGDLDMKHESCDGGVGADLERDQYNEISFNELVLGSKDYSEEKENLKSPLDEHQRVGPIQKAAYLSNQASH